jgi:hypothetical protein
MYKHGNAKKKFALVVSSWGHGVTESIGCGTRCEKNHSFSVVIGIRPELNLGQLEAVGPPER